MTDRATGDEILVGVDPRGFPAPVIALAVAEAGLRSSPLRLVLAVPPMLDTQHVDTTPQYMALRAQGERALTAAAESVTALAPEAHVETELLDGFPAAVLNQRATSNTRMVVLGSRRLSRPAEILSASSVARPRQRARRLSRRTRENDRAERARFLRARRRGGRQCLFTGRRGCRCRGGGSPWRRRSRRAAMFQLPVRHGEVSACGHISAPGDLPQEKIDNEPRRRAPRPTQRSGPAPQPAAHPAHPHRARGNIARDRR
ncbi:universal stress protein [Streptomyces niveus]|uniref:universal stress protein n=1 Tax=Streptomyces niveus TaxID=193462 RepID=UPI0009A003AE